MQILGAYYDRPFIRWAVLGLKSGKVELRSLKSFIPASPDDVKQLYMDEGKDRIVTGIQTLVRQLEFKISSRKKIEEGLPFQVESLTHLGLDELVFASQIYPRRDGADATVFFASKESLVGHLAGWGEYSIAPDQVTAIPQALLRYVQFACPSFNDGFVVHLGSEEWVCLWMKNGMIQRSFVIREGIESLLASLWEDRKKVLFQNEVKGVAKQIDLFQLKPNLNPQLSKRLEEMRGELSSVLLSFQQTAGMLPVFFTGRTDAFTHLRQYLLGSEISLYEPSLPPNLEEQKSAVAIGFALEGLAKETAKVQFLKGEFIPAKQWRKAGVYGVGLLGLSLVFSLGIWIAGSMQLNAKKEMIAASLTEVVGQMDKEVGANLFQDGIEAGVTQAMKVIQKYDKEAPYLLQSPTVSEVLTWLSNQADDSIDLIDLNYQLVSFPKIGASRDPYLAKVDMQFRVNNSMNARKFHEELLKGDYLVDPNQEITWNTLTDGYQVSFYLKNRTPYVD